VVAGRRPPPPPPNPQTPIPNPQSPKINLYKIQIYIFNKIKNEKLNIIDKDVFS